MLDQLPGPRERSPRAQAFWQGKIIYVFLVLLVVIPGQDLIRDCRERERADAEAKAKAAAALDPKVVEDERACEEDGDAKACRRAGRAYTLGLGAPFDEPRGLRLLDRACELGERPACPDY